MRFHRLACFPGALLVALACTRPAPNPVVQRANLALKVARVLDPRSGTYVGPSVVLVNGARIAEVLPASRLRPEMSDSVIDLGELTLLPGLIDSHVHLAIGGLHRAALADLNAGFTTVVDLGARSFRSYDCGTRSTRV